VRLLLVRILSTLTTLFIAINFIYTQFFFKWTDRGEGKQRKEDLVLAITMIDKILPD
jgi:hypothetical protein